MQVTVRSLLWLALVSTGCMASVEATPAVVRQNAFVKLDAQLLERIELTTEEIARNSTKEFVDHEIRAMIDLFLNNLNITIDEIQQYSTLRNNSDFDDTRMKEFQKKGMIMYENTAIAIEYIAYKIEVLTKTIEELEQFEKYIIDEDKRLKDLSDNSLKNKIKSVLDKMQTTKQFIGKHVNNLKEVDDVLKGLGEKLMKALKASNHSNVYRHLFYI